MVAKARWHNNPVLCIRIRNGLKSKSTKWTLIVTNAFSTKAANIFCILLLENNVKCEPEKQIGIQSAKLISIIKLLSVISTRPTENED